MYLLYSQNLIIFNVWIVSHWIGTLKDQCICAYATQATVVPVQLRSTSCPMLIEIEIDQRTTAAGKLDSLIRF